MTMTQTPENNLYLWWRERTPQERAEHRSRLDAVEITELFTNIREDCKLFLAEIGAAKPYGSADGAGDGPNGSTPSKTQEGQNLKEAWEKLSPEERANLERHYNPPHDGSEYTDDD